MVSRRHGQVKSRTISPQEEIIGLFDSLLCNDPNFGQIKDKQIQIILLETFLMTLDDFRHAAEAMHLGTHLRQRLLSLKKTTSERLDVASLRNEIVSILSFHQ